jgi:hypothetical protein
MGVRVTQSGNDHATLYDSTSMQAFGTVFDNQYEAEDFLEWHQKMGGQKFWFGNEELCFTTDVRAYRPGELKFIYDMYKRYNGISAGTS